MSIQATSMPDTTQDAQNTPDQSNRSNQAYIDKTQEWNALTLQPWSIDMLLYGDKWHAIISRKKLQFELQDWFDDTRMSAVLRGEKIMPEHEFWKDLFQKSVLAIQTHFDGLPLRVADAVPHGKFRIVWGALKPSAKEQIPQRKPAARSKKRPRS